MVQEAKKAHQALREIVSSKVRNLIGKHHVEVCSEKLFAFLNNETIMRHYLYTVLDALLVEYGVNN